MQRASLARRYRSDLIALFAYLALAILLTFPLVLHFGTHVAGDGRDDPALAWNLWWVPYALVHLGASPIYTDYMFYPIGLNLAFYTLTYLNAFLSIPIQFTFNLVAAANVNLLLSFVLSGYGTYLLVRYLLGEIAGPLSVDLAAFGAGALYAFSSNKLLYAALGQFNIASSHWIPFYVLILLKVFKTPHLRLGFLLGLFLLFQALSEFIFASFLIIFTATYFLFWSISHRRDQVRSIRLLVALAAAVVTFTLPMLPILAAMIQDMLTEGDFIQQGLGFADVFSSDLLGFLVPSHLNPIFGGLEGQFHFAYTNFAYLGFVALALALLALWKIPRARVWGVFCALSMLITLGPELRVNGNAIPAPFLPFNFLLEIPFVKGNRYPSRWSVMVTLCLAILAGYGMAWVLERLERRQKAESRTRKAEARGQVPPERLSGRADRVERTDYQSPITYHWLPLTAFLLLLSGILVEHASVPLSLSNLGIPAVYQTIAADAGEFTVLEIPLAWRNGFRMTGTQDAEMMFEQWYQTEHRRPILGGNTSRNPELKFQYFTDAPVINSLIAVETAHALDASVLERDKQLAPEVLRFFGIRYVVWHAPRDEKNRPALDAARAYVEQVLPVVKMYDQTDETGHTIAYRVNGMELPAQATIGGNRAGGLDRLMYVEGWDAEDSPLNWAQRPQVRLLVPLDTHGRDATFALKGWAAPPLDEQSLKVIVNGQFVGDMTLVGPDCSNGCSHAKTSVTIPARVLQAGLNEIVLEFGGLVPTSGIRTLADSYLITENGPQARANLVVQSAGSEVGDFAHIYVDGRDVSPNRRGYNLAVLDTEGRTVESTAAFDTFASADESVRLARFIAGIPDGRIVAVAVRDEGSRNLTQEAVDALATIGSAEDLRGRFRWSHAILGAKGAAPGTAREYAWETRPAQVRVGIAATEPNLAAAIESIEIR